MTKLELSVFATAAGSERNLLPKRRQQAERSGSTDGRSDAELLRMHVAGDPGAFGTLFRRHRHRLWAAAVRALGDPEEAADALQDAMIAAFRRAGSFRGDSAVTTWLLWIVVNTAVDRLRRRAARPTASRQDEKTLGAPAAVGQPTLNPSGSSDTAIDVRAALQQLGPEQQAALLLVDLLGYSVADAAQVLETSPGTVKMRAARGRARLLPRLEHLRQATERPLPARPLPRSCMGTVVCMPTTTRERAFGAAREPVATIPVQQFAVYGHHTVQAFGRSQVLRAVVGVARPLRALLGTIGDACGALAPGPAHQARSRHRVGAVDASEPAGQPDSDRPARSRRRGAVDYDRGES